VSQILATRSIAENKKLLELIEQHAANTQCEAQIMVADHKYGTQPLLKDALAAHMVQEFRDYG
jgi:DNA mismatch repair ATPase MutL